MSRPIPNVTLGGFRPNQVKINSIGIGISDATLDALNLDSSQFMVVGGQTNNVYNMIVDSEGVMINSTLENRASLSNEYALYVDGNIYVTGKVDTSSGTLSNIAGGGSNSSACNYWLPVRRDIPSSTNIYYDGKVNIANESLSRSNAYRLSVIDNANRTIDHAQVAVQNQVGAIGRTAILGYSNLSPLVFNTARGAIEFHAARTQNYFSNVYYRSNVVAGVSNYQALDLPYYACNALAPHLAINTDGTVGIKASPNPPLTYVLRLADNQNPPEIIPTPASNVPADLHVNGTTFSCNMLIYDYESRAACNIDSLYVRKLGVTFAASQVEPGYFAPGNYTFRCNVSIGGPIESDYALSVYGDAHYHSRLYTDIAVLSSNLTIYDTLAINGTAYFENDITANENVQVNQNLVIWGGLYTNSNSIKTIVPGGSNSNTLADINFVTYVANGWSNIYMQGAGFITPGKVGIGINDQYDTVPSQLTVVSRDTNIYSLGLLDKTNSLVTKALFVGHQRSNTVGGLPDDSVVFATPSSTSPYFTFDGAAHPQNIYFYPGKYDKTILGEHTISATSKPTLSVYETGQVAVNSFRPSSNTQLYVDGSVGFTSNLYGYDANSQNLVKLAQLRYGANAGVNTGTGISYIDSSAPHVGLNCAPNSNYGLAVQGGLSADAYYTVSGREGIMWLDSDTANGDSTPSTANGLYAIGKVGIGVNQPQYVLDVSGDNSAVNAADGTFICLHKALYDEYLSNVGVRFEGAGNSAWFTSVESVSGNISRYHIGCASNVYSLVSTSASNMGIIVQNNSTSGSNVHQVVIGGNASLLDYSLFNSNPNPSATLTVDGDTSIIGNLNVTGQITTNCNVYSPSNSGRSNVPSIQQDDLFISGKDVYINPTSKMYLNYNASLLASPLETNLQSVLNVYQDIIDPSDPVPIAHFVGKGANACIEILSEAIQAIGGTNDGILRVGLVNGNASKQVMGFSDGNGTPYMTFQKLGSTQRAMGINTADPLAQLHILNDYTSLNSNMVRLTYDNGASGDTASYSPNMVLDKTYIEAGDRIHKQWIIQGPTYGTSLNDQLTFSFLKTSNSIVTGSNTPLCITSNGCLGINTTLPAYLLDIVTSNTNDGREHGIRIWNQANTDTAQLVFQSGPASNVGADVYADYAMYSCNSEFILQQRSSAVSANPVLYVNSNSFIGINTTPNSNFNVNIGGVLNVTDSIRINGQQIFTTSNIAGTSGVSILGTPDVYVLPDVTRYGGLVINKAISTSNLFHVFNDNTSSSNMGVFDSILDAAHIYYRNKTDSTTYNVYQMYTSNARFGLSYTSMATRATAMPTSGLSNVFYIDCVASTSNAEHDVTLNGRITLYSPSRGVPSISFGSNGLIAGVDTTGSMYIMPGAGSNVGIGTTMPRSALDVAGSTIVSGNVGIGTTVAPVPLTVYGNAHIGSGYGGADTSFVGGPFFKQGTWDAAGTTHTITYPTFCVGDNSAGTLYIQVANKSTSYGSEKIGNLQASFIKPYNSNVDVYEISNHKNAILTALSITSSGSNIVVTTDSDCSISWTSIGSF